MTDAWTTEEHAAWYERYCAPMSLRMVGALMDSMPAARAALASATAILDVGAGTGALTRWLLANANPAARVVALEPAEAMAAHLRAQELGERVQVVIGAAESMPDVADDSIDVAVCGFSVHHMSDVPAAMRELARVVRPGGVLVVAEFQDEKPGRPESFASPGLFARTAARANTAAGVATEVPATGAWHEPEGAQAGYGEPAVFRPLVEAAGMAVSEAAEATASWTPDEYGPSLFYEVKDKLCPALAADEPRAAQLLTEALREEEVDAVAYLQGYVVSVGSSSGGGGGGGAGGGHGHSHGGGHGHSHGGGHGHSHGGGHGHSHGGGGGDEGGDQNARFHQEAFTAWYARYAAPMSLRMMEHVLGSMDAAGAALASASCILDMGAGTGAATRWLLGHASPAAQIVALDPSEAMLEKLRAQALERVTPVLGSGEAMPNVADDSVDVVFCSLSLHHCDDVPAVLREARRVLRPGGALLVVEFQPGVENPFWAKERNAAIARAANAAVGGSAPAGAESNWHSHEHDLTIADAEAGPAMLRAAGFEDIVVSGPSLTWLPEEWGPALVFRVKDLLCPELAADEEAAAAALTEAVRAGEWEPTMALRGYVAS